MTSQLTLQPADRNCDYALLHPVLGLLPGATLVSGLCVVKPYPRDLFNVGGIAPKSLTTTFVAGIGCVINPGDPVPPNPAGYLTPADQFYIYVVFTPADTASLQSDTNYEVVVQVVDSFGGTHDVERSTLPVRPGIFG